MISLKSSLFLNHFDPNQKDKPALILENDWFPKLFLDKNIIFKNQSGY